MFYNILLTAASEDIFSGLGFTTENLGEAVKLMGIGMSGIFLALFVIYLASVGLQKLFPPEDEETGE